MTKLFYCTGNDDNGDDMSWFVEANDKDQAQFLWFQHLDSWEWMAPEVFKIFEVPALTGQPGVFQWHNSNDSRPAVIEHEV